METTSDYYNIVSESSPGTTYYTLQITNFCSAQNGEATYIQYPMDSNFFDNYVRVYNNADGRPQYCIEVQRQSDGLWHVLIYNNLLQKYDDLIDYSGTTTVNGGEGWSIFETHYAYHETGNISVPCANVPNIGASGVRVKYNGVWQEIGGGASLQVTGSYTNCFYYDGTTNDYYIVANFTEPDGNAADSAWYARDPANNKNPGTASVLQGNGAGSACTVDSYGYCAVQASSAQTGSCIIYISGSPHRVYNTTTTYQIFLRTGQAMVYQSSATKTFYCGSITWSPQEPKITYNDPNLP